MKSPIETYRRKFIKGMASLGVTLSFAPLSTLASANTNTSYNAVIRKPMNQKKLGIALVGLGSYATKQLAPALKETEWCELVGAVSGTPSKLKSLQKEYGVSKKNCYNYEQFDEIANNKDIDIIYIVLPNSMHAEYTIKAAKAGKHVICEKPMAISVEEGKSMIDACEKAGVKFGIGYRLHYDPFNLEMARLGQKKVFGDPKVIEASFGFPIGDPTQWRLKKALAGGGAMMDVGIYCIQAARYVTGEEIESVSANEVKTDKKKFGEVDETIVWKMKFPSGAICSSTTTYASYVERLYLSAKDGWAELSPSYMYNGLKGRSNKGEFNFTPINQQAAQMDAFAEAVVNNKPISVNGQLGLRDMQVIRAIYDSVAQGGKEVLVSYN